MAATAASAADNVGTDVPPSPSQFVQRFVPSQELMISCGCVTVDIARRKVAIIHDSATGITQLPKGRKNIGEDLHAAAVREAAEEMGIAVRALPLRLSTRATPTREMVETFPGISVSMNGLTDGVPNCEPAAVCAYRCRSTLTFKLVFWFAAEADSTDLPDLGSLEPWEQTLAMEWVGVGEAAGRMTDVADGQVIEKVLADMRQSGYSI